MSDFKAKMHQIQFRRELRFRLCWGSLQRSTDPLAGFKGPRGKERVQGGVGSPLLFLHIYAHQRHSDVYTIYG